MKDNLFNILQNENWNDLPTLFSQRAKSKKENNAILEALSELSKPLQKQLCKGLYASLVNQFTTILYDGEQIEQTEEQPVVDNEACEEIAISILKLSYHYIQVIKLDEDHERYEGLLEMIVLTSGVLPVLKGSLLSEAVNLCEAWIQCNFEEKDQAYENVIKCLLKDCLMPNARKEDVKRLYRLHDGLHFLQLSEDSEDKAVQNDLVTAAKSPLFLSCDEGIAFISLLFSYPVLVMQIHAGIKQVIPDCTLSQSMKYGQVYFRAWKKMEDQTAKEHFEENCIQDLMYITIHVDPTGNRAASNLLHLLHYIHKQKRHYAAADMINRLYQPFLWRSLKVANGFVRMNAIAVLCGAFPFTDSNCNQEEREQLINKQYDALLNGLVDPCHLVRITTIKGLTSILADYWLMIPAHTIKKIFKIFLTELAVDASSSEIRGLVVNVFIKLLDCKAALPFIKEVISRISGSFDDINSTVRLRFIKMLLKVKAVNCVRYWEIVPLEHLLARLELDGPSIGKLITKLLVHTFFPPKADDEVLLERCLSLLEENRSAARKFYYFATHSLDIATTTHFMLLLWSTLRQYILYQQRNTTTASVDATTDSQDEIDLPGPSLNITGKRKQLNEVNDSTTSKENIAPNVNVGNSDSNKEDTASGDESEDEIALNKPGVLGGLYDIIAILWALNMGKLKKTENYKYVYALNTKVSKSLPLMFSFFKENLEVSQTILYISSFLPRSTVPTLVGHSLSRLRSLEDFEHDKKAYSTYVNALCNWNRIDDILELITDSLEQGFKSVSTRSQKERKKSKVGVRFKGIKAMNPSLSLKIIHHIFEHPLNRLAALPKKRFQILKMANMMSSVKDLIETRLGHSENLSDVCNDKFLMSCWEEYLCLVIVLHNQSMDEDRETSEEQEQDQDNEENTNVEENLYSCLPVFKQCLEWATRIILPILSKEGEEEGKRKLRDEDDALKLCSTVISSLLFLSSNAVIIGAADINFCNAVCNFAMNILKSVSDFEINQQCLKLASEVNQFLYVYHPNVLEEDEYMPVEIIKMSISSFANNLIHQTEIKKEFPRMSEHLIWILVNMNKETENKSQEIIQFIVNVIIEDVSSSIDKMKGIDDEITRIQNMDPVPAFFTPIFQSRVNLSTHFISAFIQVINSINDFQNLLACIYLLSILKEDNGKISRYSLKQATLAADTVMSNLSQPNEVADEGNESVDLHGFERLYSSNCSKILLELKTGMGIL